MSGPALTPRTKEAARRRYHRHYWRILLRRPPKPMDLPGWMRKRIKRGTWP